MKYSKQLLDIKHKAKRLFDKHQKDGSHDWTPFTLWSHDLMLGCPCGAYVGVEARAIPRFESQAEEQKIEEEVQG